MRLPVQMHSETLCTRYKFSLETPEAKEAKIPAWWGDPGLSPQKIAVLEVAYERDTCQ